MDPADRPDDLPEEPPELTSAERERLRRRVLDHGKVLADELAALLADQDLELKDVLLPEEREAGETPEERLRRALDRTNRVIDSFDEGSFGICQVCERPIPRRELEEVPWVGVHLEPCLRRDQHGLPAG